MELHLGIFITGAYHSKVRNDTKEMEELWSLNDRRLEIIKAVLDSILFFFIESLNNLMQGVRAYGQVKKRFYLTRLNFSA